MAYAEDLKSFALNGACGFDPHPGHFFLCSEKVAPRSLAVISIATFRVNQPLLAYGDRQIFSFRILFRGVALFLNFP